MAIGTDEERAIGRVQSAQARWQTHLNRESERARRGSKSDVERWIETGESWD